MRIHKWNCGFFLIFDLDEILLLWLAAAEGDILVAKLFEDLLDVWWHRLGISIAEGLLLGAVQRCRDQIC